MKIKLDRRVSIGILLTMVGVLSYGQSFLQGRLLTDSEITIGASIILDGTQNLETTQINGEFKIEKPVKKDFKLLINPCCICYVPTKIPVRKEAVELEINCNCKKSKAFIVQKLRINGEIIEKKSKVKIGN